MIEQSVLVIRTPAGTALVIDFDLDHGFDAVDDSWNPDLLFLLCRRLLHEIPREVLQVTFTRCRFPLWRQPAPLRRLLDRCRSDRSFLCTLRELPRDSDWDSSLDKRKSSSRTRACRSRTLTRPAQRKRLAPR